MTAVWMKVTLFAVYLHSNMGRKWSC